jgi:periplasmic divalent cation tolerance protein
VKVARNIFIAFVTAPDVKMGRKLAKSILERRLAACVNLVTGVESHYWWQGKLDRSSEVLLIIKTTKAKLPSLEKLVLLLHPYDTAEVIAFPLKASTPKYLRWLLESVSSTSP